jgi:hypothetical protein
MSACARPFSRPPCGGQGPSCELPCVPKRSASPDRGAPRPSERASRATSSRLRSCPRASMPPGSLACAWRTVASLGLCLDDDHARQRDVSPSRSSRRPAAANRHRSDAPSRGRWRSPARASVRRVCPRECDAFLPGRTLRLASKETWTRVGAADAAGWLGRSPKTFLAPSLGARASSFAFRAWAGSSVCL